MTGDRRLAAVRRAARRSRSLVAARPHRWAVATLVTLLALTGAATLYTARVARDDARQRVETDAAITVQTIERRLVAYGEVLVAVRGLFEIDQHPSRARFARFVSSLQLDERYPGVRVVSYARAIDATEVAGLTREVRRDGTARGAGYPPFSIGTVGRPTRLVVLDYLEPIAGNEAALGLDLLSDPVRRRALEITQSTGRPAATAPTRLVQDLSQRTAFVFMLAVRNVGGPLTSPRTGRLQGVVTAAFEVDDLLDSIVADRSGDADLEVYDVGPTAAAVHKGPSRVTAIYDHDHALRAEHDAGPRHATVPIDIGGRRWLVYYAPRGAAASSATEVPWIVAIAGTVGSLLASWLLLTLARGRSLALALARRMTRDLARSERQTRQILESAHEAFVAIDVRGRVTDWNEQAHAVFGWSREDAIGRELVAMVMPERHLEWHRRGLQHFLDTGDGPLLGRLLELTAVHRDGHEFPVELTISLVATEDGCSFNAFLRDISPRKAADEVRGRLAALVDSSEDAIIAKSLDGVIESWNRGAQELFGYGADETVGQSIAMLVPADRREELAQILAHVKRGERVDPLETVRVAKDGRRIDVSLRISLIHDAGGTVVGASAISRDITRQKLFEAELRRSSRHFDLSRDLTVTAGFDGYFKSVNPALEHILGWSTEEFLSRPFLEMVHPDDRAATLRELDRLAQGEVALSFVNRYEARDGSYRWLDWHAIVPPDEPLIYASARDITERTQMETALREAEQRFRTAFDRAPIGVCLLSLDREDPGRLLQVNPALAAILGASVDELVGASISALTHPEDHAAIHAKLGELRDGRTHYVDVEKRFLHADGHPVWALISAASLSDGDGEQTLAVTHVIDISDRKRSEGQLQHLADHDALTGLFNRRRFTEELERALKDAKRFDEAGAVLFLDLDGFKFVNDTLGHAAGDELIWRVGGLLTAAVRETDTLARMGGDEFAVLLARCDEQAAVIVAEKLLATLRSNALTGPAERRSHLSSSIGIALFRGDEGLSADEIVVEADIAMYDAKEGGKDRYAVYDRTQAHRTSMAIGEGWTERLQRAICEDSFVLHAQPIAAISGNAIPGFELLLRLPDDHGDLIPPGTFLHNAERLGLIEQIDRWVLERAVRHLHDSHAAGSDLMLSVNVSGRTMGDTGLGTHVAELLAAYPIPADRLIIEITETAAITNIHRACALAHELRALGCKLALDDFGAGFASFYYLKHLQFDYLKIDGEFIRNLCGTPTDQLVVKAIVTIAHGLSTRTVAEFVGDDATVDLLRELGVDYAQGYHLGRPRPLDEVLPYLASPRMASR